MFEQKGILLGETIDARKNVLDKHAAWEVIRQSRTVHIAKGKKLISLVPDEKSKEEILSAALGRTGNLRAPSVRAGQKLLVGFNDSIYDMI